MALDELVKEEKMLTEQATKVDNLSSLEIEEMNQKQILKGMECNMKYSIVIDDNGFPHIATNLLTVYQIVFGEGWDTSSTIELLNLCYIKSQDEFCFNRCIQLPERLRKRYNGAFATDQMIQEMESIGIVNIDLILEKIKLHEEYKDFIAYQDYRSKLQNQNYNYVEAIEEMNALKENLLQMNRKNTRFQLEKKLLQGGTNEQL